MSNGKKNLMEGGFFVTVHGEQEFKEVLAVFAFLEIFVSSHEWVLDLSCGFYVHPGRDGEAAVSFVKVDDKDSGLCLINLSVFYEEYDVISDEKLAEIRAGLGSGKVIEIPDRPDVLLERRSVTIKVVNGSQFENLSRLFEIQGWMCNETGMLPTHAFEWMKVTVWFGTSVNGTIVILPEEPDSTISYGEYLKLDNVSDNDLKIVSKYFEKIERIRAAVCKNPERFEALDMFRLSRILSTELKVSVGYIEWAMGPAYVYLYSRGDAEWVRKFDELKTFPNFIETCNTVIEPYKELFYRRFRETCSTPHQWKSFCTICPESFRREAHLSWIASCREVQDKSEDINVLIKTVKHFPDFLKEELVVTIAEGYIVK